MPFKGNSMNSTYNSSSKSNPIVDLHVSTIEDSQFPFELSWFGIKDFGPLFPQPPERRLPEDNQERGNQEVEGNITEILAVHAKDLFIIVVIVIVIVILSKSGGGN
jgi:hypothetical protein